MPGRSSAGSRRARAGWPSGTGVGFVAAGADDVRGRHRAARRYTVRGAAPGRSSGPIAAGGLVVLGSGAIPLATLARPARAFVGGRRRATTGAPSPTTATRPTSWRSPAPPTASPTCPTCPATTPCRAGSRRSPATRCADLRRRWRLAIDVDGPLDLVLLTAAPDAGAAAGARARPGSVIAPIDADPERRRRPRAPSCSSPVGPRRRPLAWLERRRAVADAGARRGARPADERARAAAAGIGPRGAARPRRAGVARASTLARLGDAAIVDTRVLLAHRLGADEAAWPARRGPLRVGPAAPRRGSATRGCATLTAAAAGGADPDPPRRPHARRTGRPARRSRGDRWTPWT